MDSQLLYMDSQSSFMDSQSSYTLHSLGSSQSNIITLDEGQDKGSDNEEESSQTPDNLRHQQRPLTKTPEPFIEDTTLNTTLNTLGTEDSTTKPYRRRGAPSLLSKVCKIFTTI